MSHGNGSLVVGGGTFGVVIVLGMTVGALIGIEGFNFLNLLGLGPATGMFSSLINTRELAAIACSLAFADAGGLPVHRTARVDADRRRNRCPGNTRYQSDPTL